MKYKIDRYFVMKRLRIKAAMLKNLVNAKPSYLSWTVARGTLIFFDRLF